MPQQDQLAPTSPSSTADRLGRRRMWGLLAVALVFRSAVLLSMTDALIEDSDGYLRLAHNWASTGTYGQWNEALGVVEPTAYRPPLYPLALAACLRLPLDERLAIASLHLLFGLATVGLTVGLGHRLGLGREAAALAALLVAADPILLAQSTRLMTETMATFLATLAIWWIAGVCRAAGIPRCGTGGRAAASGRQGGDGSPSSPVSAEGAPRQAWLGAAVASALLAVAALCRPVFLVTWAVMGTWLAVSHLPEGAGLKVLFPSSSRSCWSADDPGRRRLGAGFYVTVGLYALAGLLVMAPWLVRNWRRFDALIVATSHGGYTFRLGNNRCFYAYLRHAPAGTIWHGAPQIMQDEQAFVRRHRLENCRPRREVAVDRYHYRRAVAAIAQQPSMFARACLIRLGRLWQLVPHQTDPRESAARRGVRYAVGVWYAVVTLLALMGIWKLGRRLLRPPWMGTTALLLSVMAVHLFYWTNMRMRAPLVPQVALLAGIGAMMVARRSDDGLRYRDRQTKMERRSLRGVRQEPPNAGRDG